MRCLNKIKVELRSDGVSKDKIFLYLNTESVQIKYMLSKIKLFSHKT